MEHGNTPLMLAVATNSRAGVKTLLDESADDIDVVNDLGYTPLMMACVFGNDTIVEALLEHGANTRRKHENRTALEMAVKANHNCSHDSIIAKLANHNARLQ